jgi:hypothetical protein
MQGQTILPENSFIFLDFFSKRAFVLQEAGCMYEEPGGRALLRLRICAF